MAAWPTLTEVRSFLRMAPDPESDAVITSALAAAIDYGVGRYSKVYPPDEAAALPDSGHYACLLHASRLYRRRDSTDGTIAWSETGAMRVGRVDPDIDALYAQGAPLVFG
jgi:hypothetical protein